MIDLLLLPWIVYAACGLVHSLIVHLVTLVGMKPAPEALFLALHIGIYPLWIPVVLVMIGMTGTAGAWRLATGLSVWNAALAPCPWWMRYMTQGLFIYGIINLAIFVMHMPRWDEPAGHVPRLFWQGFSGHWMLHYSGGLAILTAAYRRGLRNLRPKCQSGHAARLGDSSCSTCGAPIDAHGAASPGRI
jgi:hypothetical protein